MAVGRARVTAATFAVGWGVALACGSGVATADPADATAEAASDSETSEQTTVSDATVDDATVPDDPTADDDTEVEEDAENEDDSLPDEEVALEDVVDEDESPEPVEEAAGPRSSSPEASASTDDEPVREEESAAEVDSETVESVEDFGPVADNDDDIVVTTAEPVSIESRAVPERATGDLSAANLTGVQSDAAFNSLGGLPGALVALFSAAFEWTRRTFFNRGPAATPVRWVQTSSGEVLGTLGVAADADAVTYTVVDGPEGGTVTVAADGTFVYTPTLDGQQVSTETDTFRVKVTQTGFHMNLLRPFTDVNTIVVPVSVMYDTVAPDTATLGYNVYNASSSAMTYTGYASDNELNGGPIAGTTIEPGEHFHFELTRYVFKDNSAVVSFTTENGGAVDIMLFLGNGTQQNYANASCRSVSNAACVGDEVGKAHLVQAYVMDPAGTVVEVSSADSQKQAQLLSSLCKNGSMATCTFKATRQERTYGESHGVGGDVINDTDQENSTTYTITDTTTQTNSLKISMTEKVSLLVEVASTQEYNYTWTETHTFTQGITLKLDPHTKGGVTASQPVFRMYGDFTLTMGNSTWILRDVYFDSPDSSRQGVYTIHNTPIAKAEEPALLV